MTDYSKVDWGKGAETFTADYGKKPNSGNGSKQVDLTQYLNLTLPDNVDEGEVVLRILPNQDEPMEFYTVKKFHNLKVGKNFVKLYDPGQDGDESPLNDKYHILKAGDKIDQENAKQYQSRDFFILRVVQRNKEAEGVKFWRFAFNYKKAGIMDKIKPIIQRLNEKNYGTGAIWNPIAGRDIVISLSKDKTKGKGREVTNVVSIMLDDEVTKLSNDEALMNKWLSDPKTWKDVYTKKNVEYLRIVADGNEPIWDQELKKFVPKSMNEAVPAATTTSHSEPPKNVNSEIEQGEAEAIPIDDLPF